MNATIAEFEHLPAVISRIELLTYEAKRLKGEERTAKLKEGQRLIDAYHDHTGRHALTQLWPPTK